MKILLINFIEFYELPPAKSLLQMLIDQGHTVSVITLAKEDYLSEQYSENKNVQFCNLVENKTTIQITKPQNLLDKVVNKFRYVLSSNLTVASYKAKLQKFETVVKESDLVWVLHEYTAKIVGDFIKENARDYFLTVYELDSNSSHNVELIEFARSAKRVIVPEYCRAHIIKAWWKLDKLPIVLPNKPYGEVFFKDHNLELERKLDQLANRKIVLYQGILTPERKIDNFIEAVSSMGDDYVFAVMGHPSPYLEFLQDKYQDKFVYLGYAFPPEHLLVTQKAFIGVLSYVATSQSINPLFCAPNKTFEYAKFSIPMIGNDIPGLKYTLDYYQMGKCVDENNVQEIVESIKVIEENYEIYRLNAKRYYDSTDTMTIVGSALKF